jgi:hypothetical protein
MKIIITATTDKGRNAIKEISLQKHKLLTLDGDKLIIKIPSHLAPLIRIIQSKTGITPQYVDFIKKSMSEFKCKDNIDYVYRVE